MLINAICTVLEYLSQIKIFQLFTTFALDRSWHLQYSAKIYTNGHFLAYWSLDHFPVYRCYFCYHLKIRLISVLPLYIPVRQYN